MAVNIGSGAEDPAKIGSVHTEVNSMNSAQIEKQPTRKTSSLKLDDYLDILQEAIRRCQDAGLDVKILEPEHDKEDGIVLVLPGVALIGGRLVAINGT